MKKILIIQARFYKNISDMLLDGATSILKKNNIDYDIVDVMGALEIAPVISMAISLKKYDGFIALGCVIRGETYHFEIVANESARAISSLSTKKRVAIANGILTTENEDQAITRASKDNLDKGGFAALACLRMMAIKEGLGINE